MRDSLRRLAFAGALLVVAPAAFAADAPPPRRPVIVFSIGPKWMRVRVAAFTNGFVYPCSSTLNTQLFEGALEPGQWVAMWSPAECVCVQHSYGDFPDLNWSPSQGYCRSVGCRGRWCSPDELIRIIISSTPNPND
jgi:hypothetical protein